MDQILKITCFFSYEFEFAPRSTLDSGKPRLTFSSVCQMTQIWVTKFLQPKSKSKDDFMFSLSGFLLKKSMSDLSTHWLPNTS